MLHSQKFSTPLVRRRMNFLLFCTGLVSTPFALSAISTPPAVKATPSLAAALVASPITSDATNAYFKIAYSGTPTWVRVFVDSDKNATSGYPAYAIGSNYMIENGRLYRYSGSNGAWGWTFVKTLTYTSGNGLASLTVARSDIGSPTAINVVTQTTAQLDFAYRTVCRALFCRPLYPNHFH